MQNVDVAIVGGGMVGLTLARALRHTQLRIAVINPAPIARPLSEQPEARVSAINLKNQSAFADMGVWDNLDTARLGPYTQMHVWDKDSFGEIEFNAADIPSPELGHIVENQMLVNGLHQSLCDQANVSLLDGVSISKCLWGEDSTVLMLDNDTVVSAKLVVGADGANSFVRQQANFPLTFKDYEHTAIVATVRSELPHDGVARQAFTPQGPLALLPLADPHLCSIVWSQDTEYANTLLAKDDNDFCKALIAASNNTLGLLTLETPRAHFPLTMRYAREWAKDGVVIIGDAAHTIHPLAGQGANLGIQDALALAETLSDLERANAAINELRNLRPFERARKTEAMKMIAAMEGFKQLFAGDDPLKKLIRGVGLTAANKLPGIKHQFVAQAMGL